MKAWQVSYQFDSDYPQTKLVVSAETREKAKYLFCSNKRFWTRVRCVRCPRFDEWAKENPGGRAWYQDLKIRQWAAMYGAKL